MQKKWISNTNDEGKDVVISIIMKPIALKLLHKLLDQMSIDTYFIHQTYYS